jgi:O-antigen ligase
VLVGLFTFNSFSPLGVLRFQLRWYHVLAFGIVVFAANRGRLNLKAALPFLLITSLTLLGAFLAPFRSGFTEDVLRNTVGLAVSLLGFLLLLPTLAAEQSRRWVIVSLLICSFLWLLKLRSVVAMLGDETRLALSGPGLDKNFIAFILVLGMTILLGVTLFWSLRRRGARSGFWIRITSLAAALGLLFSLAFTFSRSGIVVALFMISVSLIIYALKFRLRGVAISLSLLALIAVLGSIAVPAILVKLPSWTMNYDRLVNWRTDDAMRARRDLLRKGWLIVQENTIVGVGPGMSKPYVAADDLGGRWGKLIHNGYLTTWAELGLPGLAASLVLIGIWIAEVARRIRDFRAGTSDFICLLVAGAMLAMNFFLDYGTVYWLFATLTCAMAYDRRFRQLHRNRLCRAYASQMILRRAAPRLRTIWIQTSKIYSLRAPLQR